MKKFIKYFAIIFTTICAVFVLLLHCSGFQKACLLGVLRCCYKDVRIENFSGGTTEISWDKMVCKAKDNALTVGSFELKWYPWQLVFHRTLKVDVLRCDINFTGEIEASKNTEVKSAGWFLSKSHSKTCSILEKIQCPVKLDVSSAIVNLAFSSKDISLRNGILKLQDMHPGHTGTFCYDGKVFFPKQRQIVVHGECALQANKHGVWEKVRCSGDINMVRGNVRYPRLNFNSIIDGVTTNSKEEVRAELHCGQANDFLLTGEYVKGSDRVYDFKWQGFFDHSLLKFFDVSTRPVISLLTEGNCVYHKKRCVWASHAYLSAWGKHFEAIHPSLKSLPCLSFKAQLDADIGAQQIDLKQYKFVLKEKSAPRVFLDVTSLQPLTYCYKGGNLGLSSKEDAQTFEMNFYETPFEIFNPYLKQYGFQVMGNLQSGNVNVGWNAKEKRWTIATFQPICAQIRQLTKGDDVCLKNVTFRLSENCAIKRDFSEINYDINWIASDLKHVPFLKYSPKGYVNLKNKTASAEGSLFLDNVGAKDLFNFETFGVKLDPNLLAKMSYNLDYQKENLLVNQLKFSLNSSVDKTMALELKTEQPLYFSSDCWTKSTAGSVVSLKAKNYPLDAVQYAASAFSGICNGQFSINKIEDRLQCVSDTPLRVSDFKWCAHGEDRLSLKNVLLHFNGDCNKDLRWSVRLPQIQIVSDDEQHPLWVGNCDVQGVKKQLESSHGQVVFNLDKLCAQPIMLKYPGFVGEFNSHWAWDEKQTEANARLRCQPLESSLAIEAKSSYKHGDKPSVKTALELQSKEHSSDVYADTTWDKNGSIDCQLNSERLFVKDIIQCCQDLKLLKDQFLDNQTLKTKESGHEMIVAESNPTVASASKDISNTPKETKKELPFQGLLHLSLKSVYADTPFLENLNGTIAVQKDGIHMENLQGDLCSGKIELKTDFYAKNECLKMVANGHDIKINQLLRLPSELGYPMDKYGQMAGDLAVKVDLSGEVEKPFSWYGVCDIACKNGYYKIFNSSNKAGQAMGGIASTLGLLLSANVSGMGTVGFLTSYLQKIPYNEIGCSCSRDVSDEIMLKGWAVNKDLAVSVDGDIGMKQNLNCLQQPLNCSVKFSAPEKSPFSNYFSFDSSNKDSNGYCIGPSCKLGGTLGNPDYSSLVKLVTSARSEKPETPVKASPVQQLLKTLF